MAADKRIIAAALGLCVLMTTPASAAFWKRKEPFAAEAFGKTSLPGGAVTFTAEDFQSRSTGELAGSIVTDVPEAGRLTWSGQEVCPGKVISCASIGAMRYVSGELADSFSFRPIFAGSGAADEDVTVSLFVSDRRSAAPVARSAHYETYRDVPLTGRLTSYDPDGGACVYHLADGPEHGTVTLEGDRFLYTPGTAGLDVFTVTADDGCGSVSAPATVTVSVKKRPAGGLIYDDMAGREHHYEALRLAEVGLMRGETVGASSFFDPDGTLTRAQFAALTVALSRQPLPASVTVTGMGDNDAIPVWARAAVAAAVRCGIVSGEAMNGNRVFRPNDTVTRGEAAVMLDRLLQRGDDGREAVFTDDVPDWCAFAAVNACACGLMDTRDCRFDASAPLTRLEAAAALCRAMDLLDGQ